MADSNTEQKKETGGITGAIHQAGAAVHSVADSATTAVGSGMESLAGTIRENTPHDGMVGTASTAVANTLESGGRYLKEHTPADMFNDVTEVVRKNPMTCLMIGLGVGFLLARMLKR
jgi:hypothetical protein